MMISTTNTPAAQINDGDIDRKKVAIEKPAGQPSRLVGADLSPRPYFSLD
jgi:hypothetical protein